MKKVFIPIGIILVIVGIIIVGVYGGADAWKSLGTPNLENAKTHHSFSVVQTETEQPLIIKSIAVASDSFDVYVRKTAETAVTVKYSDSIPKGSEITVNYIADSQTLTVEESDSFGGFIFVWGFNRADRFIIVDIPESLLENGLSLRADVDVGKLEVKDLSFESLWCETATGSLRAENCSAKDDAHMESNTGSLDVQNFVGERVTLQSNTGRVYAKGVKCNALKVEVNTGSADVDECIVADSIQINSSTGSVSCTSTSKNLSIINHTGSVYFRSSAESINVSVDTGRIKGVVQGKKTEYNITVKNDIGKSNLQNQFVANGKQLTVETDTGSIDVTFGEN